MNLLSLFASVCAAKVATLSSGWKSILGLFTYRRQYEDAGEVESAFKDERPLD